MASSFEERGLTADLHLRRRATESRQSRHMIFCLFVAVFVFMAILLCNLAYEKFSEEGLNTKGSYEVQGKESYEFAVYTLNHTKRTSTGMKTVFSFETEALPFDFKELRFGDFRCDTMLCSRYYGGMSLLARAEGPTGYITFSEMKGELIENIFYEGQSLIVLNSWEIISKDSCGGIMDNRWGSMQIAAYDWRNGVWSPEDGFVVEHPANVTIHSATICLIVYELASKNVIPEFDPLWVCIGLVGGIVIGRRIRGAKSPSPRTSELLTPSTSRRRD